MRVCVCVCARARMSTRALSCVCLFATAWTVVRQALLSMGIFQARILEWVAVPSFRGSSQPRGCTQVSCMQVDSLTPEPPGKFTKWDSISLQGIFRWHSGKESASQCRRLKRIRFDPCVGKIPWSGEWQLDQLFFPGKFHGPRSLAGLPMGLQRVGHHWAHTYPK